MLLRVYIDCWRFKVKPTKKEIPHIRKRMREQKLTIWELHKALENGQTVQPALLDAHGRFRSQQVFLVEGETHGGFRSGGSRGIFFDERREILRIFFLSFREFSRFRLRIALRDGVERGGDLTLTQPRLYFVARVREFFSQSVELSGSVRIEARLHAGEDHVDRLRE